METGKKKEHYEDQNKKREGREEENWINGRRTRGMGKKNNGTREKY